MNYISFKKSSVKAGNSQNNIKHYAVNWTQDVLLHWPFCIDFESLGRVVKEIQNTKFHLFIQILHYSEVC